MLLPTSLKQHLTPALQRQFILTLLVSLLAAAAEVIPIYILLELVQALLAGASTGSWLWLLLLSYLLKLVLVSGAYGLSHQGAYKLILLLRCKLLKNLETIPLERLQEVGTADLKQCMIQDVEQLETSLAHHSVEGIIALFFPLFLGIALWQLQPLLLLAALVPLVFAFWQMQRLSRIFQQDQLAYSATVAKLNSAIQAFIRCLPMMRVYQQDSRRFKLFVTQQKAYKDLIETLILRAAPAWVLFSASVVGSVFVITLTAYVLLQLQQLSVTDFYLAVFLAMVLLRPVLKITRLSSELDLVLQCWQRLLPWLKTPEVEALRSPPAKATDALITMNDVSYSIKQQTILQYLTLSLPPEPVTLIAGPSGSGKSILLQMMAGLRQPSQGVIQQSHHDVVLVEQQAHIFNASLRDNLSLGKPLPDQALFNALEAVQLGYLPSRFEQGLDAQLAFRGNNLSGGERQRLALARALLSDAKVLLLDEVIAFSDQRTQQQLLRAIRRDYTDRYLILVSHCLLPGLDIDHVLVMAEGKLVKQGCYAEVMQDNTFLKRFSQQQEIVSSHQANQEVRDAE